MGKKKLKPCPFCGGNGRVWMGDKISKSHCFCDVCGSRSMSCPKDEQAIRAWNTRSPGTPTVEELLKARRV